MVYCTVYSKNKPVWFIVRYILQINHFGLFVEYSKNNPVWFIVQYILLAESSTVRYLFRTSIHPGKLQHSTSENKKELIARLTV